MTPTERDYLLSGVHFDLLRGGPLPGYYTGTTNAIPRLGVPALKMADAANGFRPTDPGEDGSTTCWPSMLALASTWDEALVREVAGAIGEEFRGKGANVILGPSVNVHRSAANGRNFEYLSGEDPTLGARLTRAYVEGVQCGGLMAVAKHFAFNEQESNRMGENSMPDDRTAWELYYPPFQAAVEAGVGAFMCSYNKVNGSYACQNPDLLSRDLKGRMEFPGFVMSDWGATHSVEGVENGLDQEMPGTLEADIGPLGALVHHFVNSDLDEPSRREAVDAAALRVLTSMYRLRLDDLGNQCVPPNCSKERSSVQRSDAHSALARRAAGEAAVLLKNDGALPINVAQVRRLAILGAAANNTAYFAGGGSGHVPLAAGVETPWEAIARRAAAADVEVVGGRGAESRADLAVIIAGAQSSEMFDRMSLGLDGGGDELIAEVSGKVPTVVVMLSPGAVLTPWRGEAAAVVNLFFGGEETGNAIADVLFGDVVPSGKLPVQFPATGDDLIWPKIFDLSVPYSEGLFTSYRSPEFKAAFPFGHGLSYTSFEYGAPEKLPVGSAGCTGDGVARCLRVAVTNVGKSPGREVVQVYLQFDERLQHPRLMLRAFQKTSLLQPGQTQKLTLRLSPRDLAVYEEGAGWTAQSPVTAHIGSSSADLRGSVQL